MQAIASSSASSLAVPTIELGRAWNSPAALAQLDAACREHGFFLLTGHGIDAEVAAMWRASAAFFTGARTNQLAVKRTADQPLGYYDRELTKQRRDLKEVFDFTQPRKHKRDPNQWPTAPADFQAVMSSFYSAAGALAERTLELVYTALVAGLQPGQPQPTDSAAKALPGGSVRTSNVRLNYYPLADPLSAAEQRSETPLGDMALQHHTDPGLLTLLLQDSTGGLQTQSRDGQWLDIPANPDAVVVNLGDALQVISNDRYRAAIHRVLPMRSRARYSTPFFLNPQPDAILAPEATLSNEPARYRPFGWREYIQHRIDDNFADLAAEDTQISHYRLTA